MAKYRKEIVDKIVSLIKEDSYTIVEICHNVGISESTFHDWKEKKPEFLETIKRAHEQVIQANLKTCEKSLNKLINGYEYEEKKIVTVDDGKGHPKIKEQTVIKKHIAPNLGAIIHYQTNKDPENWKNKQTTELTGKDGKDLIPEIKIEIIDKIEDVRKDDSSDKNI